MGTFVLMAGGTGGHLFPAMALAEELNRRGHVVHLATDHRVESYGGDFPARQIHIIPSASPSLRNPVQLVKSSFIILGGLFSAWRAWRKVDPDAVVAFGGYPSFPPFLAASLMGIPGVLHEANAVMGRANRALARFADALALPFDNTRHAEKFNVERVVTGNPMRDAVRAAAGQPYPMLDDGGPIDLLVFGGSQGARAFSDIVPSALQLLPDHLRRRLRVTQQCRPEDLERVTKVYRDAHINIELATFFADLPKRIANSHLVISRSGAMSVSEICVLGRPAIFVPLPGSIDQDQKANATLVEAAGGGWMMEQANLSPQLLATRLEGLFTQPDMLRSAARAARSMGRADGVEKLADLAERMAAKHTQKDQ